MKLMNIVLRILIGGVFVWAGIIKIIDPANFAGAVANYRLLPENAVNLLAITLPWIEFVAGLLLVLGMWSRASALVIVLMTCVFLIAVGQAVARGLNINCGCFGTVEGRKVGLSLLVQDAALLLATLWICVKSKSEQ